MSLTARRNLSNLHTSGFWIINSYLLVFLAILLAFWAIFIWIWYFTNSYSLEPLFLLRAYSNRNQSQAPAQHEENEKKCNLSWSWQSVCVDSLKWEITRQRPKIPMKLSSWSEQAKHNALGATCMIQPTPNCGFDASWMVMISAYSSKDYVGLVTYHITSS